MTCEELREFYEQYALGVCGEPERSEIRAHLNRNCEVCMLGVKRALEMAAFLSGSAPGAAPSPKLRRRILASVGFEQKKIGWAPFWGAAAVLSIAAAVYFSGREREFAEDARRLQEQLRTQMVALARLNEAFEMMNGPDTVVTSFGQKEPAKGKVFANPRGILLMASNLPAAPAGKMYEMWVIPKGGRPEPAGMFQSTSQGSALHIWHRNVSAGDTVAVTMELEAGSATPTMPIVIAAQLPAAPQ